MSLIGQLAATEMQIHLDWLHMSSGTSISLEDPNHSHYTHSAILFRSLKMPQETTWAFAWARGTWPPPESKLHINYLEVKVVFLALKEFHHLCTYQIVLIATYNTTVVACINKEKGGHEIGPNVCPTVENPVLVLQEASDSPFLGLTHSRPTECSSRHFIQAW